MNRTSCLPHGTKPLQFNILQELKAHIFSHVKSGWWVMLPLALLVIPFFLWTRLVSSTQTLIAPHTSTTSWVLHDLHRSLPVQDILCISGSMSLANECPMHPAQALPGKAAMRMMGIDNAHKKDQRKRR